MWPKRKENRKRTKARKSKKQGGSGQISPEIAERNRFGREGGGGGQQSQRSVLKTKCFGTLRTRQQIVVQQDRTADFVVPEEACT